MINFKNKKFILFDLDNTLINTEGNSHTAMRLMYDELNLNNICPDFDTFWSVYHECNEIIWEDYRQGRLDREGLNAKRFTWPLQLMNCNKPGLSDKINEVFYKYFLPLHQVMPYTYEILEYLKPKYSLAILSNGTKSSQKVKMDNCQFHKYFNGVYLSDDLGVCKPNAEIFTKVFALTGFTPSETIMIGDDLSADILGANNAKVDSIWYKIQDNSLLFPQVHPTYTITSLYELFDLF